MILGVKATQELLSTVPVRRPTEAEMSTPSTPLPTDSRNATPRSVTTPAEVTTPSSARGSRVTRAASAVKDPVKER